MDKRRDMREINIREVLKRGLILSVAIGVFAGLLFGVAKAFLFVKANRYFELGMHNIAFDYSLSILNSSFPLPLLVVGLIGIVVSAAHIILRSYVRDAQKVNRLTLGAAVFLATLVLWLFAGYYLNQADWYPRSTTFWGILYNVLLTGAFIMIGLLLYKLLPSGYSSFRKIFSFKLVLAVAVLMLVLNGYFYYDKFFNVWEGTNVIFISVDTLRADHLGYSGYVRDTSPNIDAFARDGVIFSQAIAQAPQTTPSFASMLTSTYGHTNGVVGDPGKQMKMDNYFVLLAEVLRNDNYNTMGVVSNLYLASEFGFDQGIETYVKGWKEVKVGGRTDHEHSSAENITEVAVDWLRGNYDRGKFFMWVHYMDPHAAYAPPEPFGSMFVGDEFYDRKERVNLVAPDPQYPDIGGVREKARLGDNDVLDFYVARYDGEIRYVDESIKVLLNEIKKLGVYDNTLIIFTSDHGESLGDHNYYFWHGRLPYDDCLHIPLVIKFPAGAEVRAGRVSQPVGLIDLLPTVLSFLNLPVPEEAEGKSLMSSIRGESDGTSPYIFSEAGYEEDYQRVIRTTRNWKFIYIPDEDTQKIMNDMPFELYNIEDDPNEQNNLFNFEDKISIVDDLRRDLFGWMDSAHLIEGVSSPKTVEVNKEMEEKLKSLGYIQ